MAAQFTAATSESLSIADNASLSIGDVDFDMAGWVYLDTTPASGAQMGIIGKWQSSNLEYVVLVDNTGGTIRFQFLVRNTANDATTTVTASTFGTPSVETNYFIHVYHDSTNDVIGISVNDGTADTAATTGGVRNGTAAFAFGEHTAGSYLNGRASAWRLWKTTLLTAAQITRLYNAGVGLADEELGSDIKANLVSSWELDEPSGVREDLHGTNDLADNNTVTSNPGVILNAVGTWANLAGTGSGFDAAQSTQSKKPRIRVAADKRVFKFDGGDQLQLSGAGLGLLRNVGGATVLLVLQTTLPGAAAWPFIVSTGTGDGTGARLGYGREAVGPVAQSDIRVRRLDGDVGSWLSGDGLVAGTWNIETVVVDYSNTRGRLFRDGAVKVDNTSFLTAGNTSDTDSIAVTVGAQNTVNAIKGEIAAVLVFNRALMDIERTRSERYEARERALLIT